MADLSQLSNDQLQQLYAINKNETGGAPDSSTVKSDKGASGSMQVMPKTAVDPGYGVKPSNGTPEDTAREGRDYYLALHDKYQDPTTAAIAYNWGPGNTDKWLASGGDLSKVPDEALKYAYNYNDTMKKAAPAASANPLANISDDDLTKMHEANQPGALEKAGDWLGDKASGIGQVAAQMGTGMVGMAAGGLRGLADLATGDSAHASSDIANTENALTYQPRTATGQAMSQAVNNGIDKYVTQPLNKGGEAAISAIPFIGEDLQKSGVAKDIAEVGTGIFENFAPLHLIPKGLGRLAHGSDIAGAAGELDKLNAAGAPEGPQAPASTPPNMGPNEGPPRPPINVDSRGNAVDPLADPNMAAYMKNATDQQAAAQANAPYTMGPNEGPQVAPTREPLIAGSNGDVGTAAQMNDPGYLAAKEMPNSGPQIEPDVLQQRMSDMANKTPEQLDLFSDDQPGADARAPEDNTALAEGYGEAPRSLSQDEFTQTLSDLSAKDGTRFQMPEDIDAAYEKYIDTVHDDNGQLFDRPTMAKNFADMALKDSITRRIQDHPIIQANTARVAGMQARVDALGARAPQSARDALTQAQATLQKSVDNIGKNFKDAAKQLSPWEKDGIVYMHTFGDLGTLAKSIGAVLKGIHGLVFKTLDKVVPKFRSLDSTGKIMGQGIKDAINKQATRDWSQTVNEKPREQLNGIPGMRKALDAYNPYEAQPISDAEIKGQILQANDISDTARNTGINHVLQGGMQLSSFYRNPLIKVVTESVDRAQRNVKQYVRDNLLGKDGLRTKMQDMTSDELTGIRSHMELNEGKREFSPSELKSQGFNAKQIDYYTKSLELEKQAFSTFNEGRARAGLPPVDARVAHIAGYFMGDFKTLVHDTRLKDALNPDGKVVAVLSHNNRFALNTITKRFMEDHPDAANFKVDEPKLNKLKESGTGADNRFHGYMEVLNMMQHGDTNMAKVVKAYQDHMTSDAMNAMKNRSKFKSETGVIGAEGRKSWQSASENAKDGARQQLRYLESVSKWSEMQKAIDKSKTFLSDPDVSAKAPNASKLSQQYLDSVQGRNQGPIANSLNAVLNGFADATGIGPSILKGGNNVLKSTVLAKFVGIMKLSHSAVTLLQPILGMPFTNALMRERGLDIPWMHGTAVKSVAKGLNSAFQMSMKDKTGNAFMDAAKDYMAKNGTADVGMSNHYKNVTATSKVPEMIGNIAHANVSIPEAGARTFTFMYYSHLLQDMGLPKDEIFPTAHNAMREVMVDYGAHERPMMFGKMSLLGDIASTLTRFKYNTVGKHLIGAADVQRSGMGSVGPLVHMIGASIAGAGIRGIFGYEAANQAVKLITQLSAQAGIMKNSTSLDELVLNAMHGLKNTAGEKITDMLNWGALGGIGVNMTGSLSNSDTIPMDPLGALIPGQGELGTLAKSAANLAVNHNKQSMKQFGLNVLTPNSMKGMAENAFFTDPDGTFHNPATGLKEVSRTPAEQMERNFSFRPLNESKRGLVARTLGNVEGGDTEDSKGAFTGTSGLKHDFLERAKSDLMSNNGKPDPASIQKWAQRYVSVGGDPSSFVSDMNSFVGKGQHLDRLQRAEGIPTGGSLSEITRYQRGKAME